MVPPLLLSYTQCTVTITVRHMHCDNCPGALSPIEQVEIKHPNFTFTQQCLKCPDGDYSCTVLKHIRHSINLMMLSIFLIWLCEAFCPLFDAAPAPSPPEEGFAADSFDCCSAAASGAAGLGPLAAEKNRNIDSIALPGPPHAANATCSVVYVSSELANKRQSQCRAERRYSFIIL